MRQVHVINENYEHYQKRHSRETDIYFMALSGFIGVLGLWLFVAGVQFGFLIFFVCSIVFIIIYRSYRKEKRHRRR